MKEDVTYINQRIWFAEDIALEYAREQTPVPAETAILHQLGDTLQHASLLDIGIGAGRTTAFLAPACNQYVGIDYSQAMIDIATARFPNLPLHQQDARDLSAFAEASVDMVWFSYNGIDYVPHEDRLRILQEIRRILKPNGLFIFSSHNRDHKIYPAYHWKNLQLTINPKRMARRVIGYLTGIINAIKHRAQQIQTDDYAILNDQAHHYTMLTYYISGKKQIEQLNASGFAVEGLWGMKGERLKEDEIYVGGYNVYYLAKRYQNNTSIFSN